MPNLRGSEWLIIILLVVLLFGAKRLPDAARSIGRSLRIFKAETKGLVDESAAPASGTGTTTTPTAAPAVTATATGPALEAGAPAAPGAMPPAAAAEPVTVEPASALAPQPETGSALHPHAPASGQQQA
jgi:sec-independent protein translocase protein TatA